MSLPESLAAQIAAENVSPMPDEADQIAYAERHGNRQFLGWPEESDIQIAARARMLMRDDWMHEAVCTATRDRICALWVENRRLRQIIAIADELVNGGGLYTAAYSDTPKLCVREKADKSDPHYRLCTALEAFARDSGSDPQGEDPKGLSAPASQSGPAQTGHRPKGAQ